MADWKCPKCGLMNSGTYPVDTYCAYCHKGKRMADELKPCEFDSCKYWSRNEWQWKSNCIKSEEVFKECEYTQLRNTRPIEDALQAKLQAAEDLLKESRFLSMTGRMNSKDRKIGYDEWKERLARLEGKIKSILNKGE